ncbi:MAG: transporter [Hydrocarboniphaga sp.]|uniref:MFS transporter n=1 Tax=Hydrocarboniphaga sp. TaxID=2033016 RepID=UPI002606BB0C|nr:MFS transporter [Hydrocarboniphaga sp.]MDB5972698.1 transporter [Hydrocarboniphaga sp.]
MSSPRHDPYAALRHAPFRRLITANLLLSTGVLIQAVVLGYALYQMTHDPLALGLIGLAEAVPFIGLALFGGHLADRREKTRLMQMAGAVIAAGSALLLCATLPSTQAMLSQPVTLGIIYTSVFMLGLARGIYSPASASLRPFLIPREIYSNSASWNATFFQAGAIAGPVLAGFLYVGVGLTGTLIVVLAMVLINIVLIGRIEKQPVSPPAGIALWASLREGIAYVWKTKILLYAISLDMFSVLFGGVVAILPIFAEDILKVGPQGLGLLRAAPAAGALITVIACNWYPPTRRPWSTLLLVVAGFGVATLAFAVSKTFWLSAAALFASGAFDSVSVVIRNTLLQTLPADHMRGRVASVNSIFISASNELGAFESGLAAKLLGTVPSVIAGGMATLGVVGYIWTRSRALFKVRLM